MAGELVKALIAAKKAFKPLMKTRENTFFHSKYADLADLHEAVDAALEANGFAVTHPLGFDDQQRYGIKTQLLHVSGDKLESFYLLSQALEPQKFGAAITYGCRGSLAALLGIPADDDDDGNSTQEAHAAPAAAAKPSKPKEYKLKPQDAPKPIEKAPEAVKPVQEPLVVPIPPAPRPQTPDGFDSALIQVIQVSSKVKEGTGARGPWKLWNMKIRFQESGIEAWASTFSEGVHTLAEQYRGNGLSILMNYKEKQNGEYTNITIDELVEVANGEPA